MLQGSALTTHGLFERVRGVIVTHREGHPVDSSEARTERPSERVLLLPLRDALSRGRRCGVFSFAVAVPDRVHGRLCSGIAGLGLLVRPRRQTTETRLVILLQRI